MLLPQKSSILVISWRSSKLKEMMCFTFLKMVDSKSSSLTRMGNQYDLIRIRFFFRCWNQMLGKHCNNVPEIAEDQIKDYLILHNLKKLRRATMVIFTFILTLVKCSRQLSPFMTLGEFPQDAAQFNLMLSRYAGIKVSFVFCFVLPVLTELLWKKQRRDEDQSCRGILFLPQVLTKWVQFLGHVYLSTLLFL